MSTIPGSAPAGEGTANVPAGASTPVAAGDGSSGEGGDGSPPVGSPPAAPDPTPAPAAGAGEGPPPPGEGKPPAEGEPEPAAAGEAAPETYEFSVGEDLTLDPAATEAFTAYAKEHKLSQAEAQRVVDIGADLMRRQMESLQQQGQQTIEQWADQARADPLVGGARFDENVQIAQAAATKFGDPEFTKLLNDYGLGNHPAFVRAFYRIGKAAGEAGFVDGQGSGAPAKPVNREAQLAARMEAEQARARGS